MDQNKKFHTSALASEMRRHQNKKEYRLQIEIRKIRKLVRNRNEKNKKIN